MPACPRHRPACAARRSSYGIGRKAPKPQVVSTTMSAASRPLSILFFIITASAQPPSCAPRPVPRINPTQAGSLTPATSTGIALPPPASSTRRPLSTATPGSPPVPDWPTHQTRDTDQGVIVWDSHSEILATCYKMSPEEHPQVVNHWQQTGGDNFPYIDAWAGAVEAGGSQGVVLASPNSNGDMCPPDAYLTPFRDGPVEIIDVTGHVLLLESVTHQEKIYFDIDRREFRPTLASPTPKPTVPSPTPAPPGIYEVLSSDAIRTSVATIRVMPLVVLDTCTEYRLEARYSNPDSGVSWFTWRVALLAADGSEVPLEELFHTGTHIPETASLTEESYFRTPPALQGIPPSSINLMLRFNPKLGLSEPIRFPIRIIDRRSAACPYHHYGPSVPEATNPQSPSPPLPGDSP